MQFYNILVVEDDDIDMMTIERSFKKANITNKIIMAKDGIEAWDLLKSQHKELRPLVMLLDINMPRMGGLELLQNMRADPELKDISVVILTTSNHEKDKTAFYNMNVAGYVIKPINFDDFVYTMAAIGKYWSLCEFV